jgi:hypothetical protein
MAAVLALLMTELKYEVEGLRMYVNVHACSYQVLSKSAHRFNGY